MILEQLSVQSYLAGTEPPQGITPLSDLFAGKSDGQA
jgi:hypothetical protein